MQDLTEKIKRRIENSYFEARRERGKQVYVTGPKENIFHWHPLVKTFNSFNDFIEYLDNKKKDRFFCHR